jgi:hypothetical protein
MTDLSPGVAPWRSMHHADEIITRVALDFVAQLKRPFRNNEEHPAA